MNALYDFAAVSMMSGNFNWMTADLMLVAWSAPINFLAADRTLADIKGRGGIELGSSLTIENQSVASDGTGKTDSVLIPGIPIGPEVTWMTLCQRKPTHDASELILFIDEAEGLPYVPNGQDLLVQPDWLTQRGWFRP